MRENREDILELSISQAWNSGKLLVYSKRFGPDSCWRGRPQVIIFNPKTNTYVGRYRGRVAPGQWKHTGLEFECSAGASRGTLWPYRISSKESALRAFREITKRSPIVQKWLLKDDK